MSEFDMRKARLFPCQGGPAVPWDLIAPHEAQAIANHEQSLEELARRGGLSPNEMMCVLEDKRLSLRYSDSTAREMLCAVLRQYHETRATERVKALEAERDALREQLAVRDAAILAVEQAAYELESRLAAQAEELRRYREFVRERHPVNASDKWICLTCDATGDASKMGHAADCLYADAVKERG